MKRLRRLAWNVLAAMSALLCVTTVLLWPRSYYFYDQIQWTGSTHAASVEYFAGRIEIQGFWVPGNSERIEEPSGFSYSSDPVGPAPVYDLAESYGYTKCLGIAFRGDTLTGGYGPPYHSCLVVLPFWMLVVTLALLPAWRTRTLVKRKRAGVNVCRSCGYDLRATPLRCPECGTIPAGNEKGTP